VVHDKTGWGVGEEGAACALQHLDLSIRLRAFLSLAVHWLILPLGADELILPPRTAAQCGGMQLAL
jgi:hypothetical protein